MINNSKNNHIAIIVFGDIGRSPRMQNHCIELLRMNQLNRITIYSYYETQPKPELLSNSRVDFSIINVPKYIERIYLKFKFVSLIGKLLYLLLSFVLKLFFSNNKYDYLLVQNPPSFPSLLISRVYCLIYKKCTLIVDWHNTGFSILELKYKNRILINLAKKYEKYIVRNSSKTYHICVSDKMKQYLNNEFKIVNKRILIIKDKPTNTYKMTRNNISRYNQNVNELYDKYQELEQLRNSTHDILKHNLIVIISSTSWTKDEDFAILLNALLRYNIRKRKPKLLCIITGKGPEKIYYEDIIKREFSEDSIVKIITIFVKIEDYFKLISICDIGVCLHKSSSKLDLPMKVVDMFSCYIPVLAYKYDAIDELVIDDFNGRLFSNERELYRLFVLISHDYETAACKTIIKYKNNLELFNSMTFHMEWTKMQDIIKQHD